MFSFLLENRVKDEKAEIDLGIVCQIFDEQSTGGTVQYDNTGVRVPTSQCKKNMPCFIVEPRYF